jgi:hypothetical protein
MPPCSPVSAALFPLISSIDFTDDDEPPSLLQIVKVPFLEAISSM